MPSIEILAREMCPDCQGRRAVSNGARKHACYRCKGSGKVSISLSAADLAKLVMPELVRLQVEGKLA